MIEASERERVIREDARYKAALAHLQAGRWAEAVAAFQTLVREYPESAALRRSLDEARWKADLDSRHKITPRRSTFNWRKWLLRGIVLGALAVLVWRGVPIVQSQVLPAIAQMQEDRRIAALRSSAFGLYERGKDAEAVAQFDAYLAERPDDAEARTARDDASLQVQTRTLYEEGVALQDRGSFVLALDKLRDVDERIPDYLDVRNRISTMEKALEIEDLFAAAEAERQAGQLREALGKYEAIRQTNISYRRETITNRLYELYFTLGRQMANTWPAERASFEQALDYLSQALSVRPRDAEVLRERQLITLYLDGEDRYYAGRWDEAISMWARLYEDAPDYLDGHLRELLYDAYVRSGDAHMLTADYYYAYEQYRRASELGVPDIAQALKGMAAIDAMLLPTPTPTPTRTPTPIPSRRPGGGGVAGPTPTPTPASLLGTYSGKIAFYSDNPQQPGIWVMDPDGQNRQFVGNSQDMHQQFNALAERARYAPGGVARLYVSNDGAGTAQIFASGASGEQQLTYLGKLCYDPVWSPDGSRVAFVSQHDESDDIWVMNADGSAQANLTKDEAGLAAWDKHPAWSPDSKEIAFWSSRTGVRQIHLMGVDGSNVRNISNTPWDEYDPIWIR